MPWQPKDAAKHTKAAQSDQQKKKWAEIANAVLERDGDEGKAIRIANSRIRMSKPYKGK